MNNLNSSVGHWIYGAKRTDLPSTGSASYLGNVIGDYIPNVGQVERSVITGDMSLNVAFNTGSIDGSMNLQRGGVDWASANFNQPNAIEDSEFKIMTNNIDIAGGGTGKIEGFFAGPDVEEIGGSFAIQKQSGDRGSAAGICAGKKN